jgi:hypothetical protein
MRALVWKKAIEFKNNKIRSILFFVMPILYLIFLRFYCKDIAIVAFYMPIICTYLCIFLGHNLEDMAYESTLLLTPVTPKRRWIANSLIISVSSYLWSGFCLIIWACTFHLSYRPVVFSLLNLLAPFALVLSVTLYCVDYSKLKQWLQVPFGVSGIVLFFMLCICPDILPHNEKGLLLGWVLSLLIVVFCLLLNRKSTPEDLVINTDNMLRAYVSNILNE